MDDGKSLLTVPGQTDVNRLQGIKLLSAESLRKAMQIRDEIAKAKKRKEAEKSTAELLRHSAEGLVSELSGAGATSTNSINKSPLQPFKIINGPHQNLSSNMPNCDQQKPGTWTESKDRDLAGNGISQNKMKKDLSDSMIKTPTSDKCNVAPSSFKGATITPKVGSRAAGIVHCIDPDKFARDQNEMNKEDRLLSVDRSRIHQSSLREAVLVGKPIVRSDYQESFKQANSILSKALNTIEQMERSSRCTEREEAKMPAASFIGDVRAHLIELQTLLTRNERDFEVVHLEKELLSRQLQLASTHVTESSDVSTFFTPSSSRDCEPHCSSLKGIRPLSVSEMRSSHNATEDGDDTLIESNGLDDSISSKPMGTMNSVNVDVCLHRKLAAATSETCGFHLCHTNSRNGEFMTTKDHPKGATACSPEKGDQCITPKLLSDKQVLNAQKLPSPRLPEGGHLVHFNGVRKWDHRLNEEARVWYHDHVGSRIEKVILEVKQLRDQLHQQTSELIQSRNSREAKNFKSDALERKIGECSNGMKYFETVE